MNRNDRGIDLLPKDEGALYFQSKDDLDIEFLGILDNPFVRSFFFWCSPRILPYKRNVKEALLIDSLFTLFPRLMLR